MNTGRITGTTNFVETNPLPLTRQLLERGRERYQISCSPCHGALGDGKGITTQYGMTVVANLHDTLAKGSSNGPMARFSTPSRMASVSLIMGPYGANISVDDRWAIVAYVRALQLSRLGTIEDVPDRQTRIIEKVTL